MSKKKAVVPKDSRYVPLTQQPYCCVPTSIQMVMLRHGLPLVPAELMAHHLDVIVSPERKWLYYNLRSQKQRPSTGWGTRISEDKTVNKMFRKLKIPLRMEFRLSRLLRPMSWVSIYMKVCALTLTYWCATTSSRFLIPRIQAGTSVYSTALIARRVRCVLSIQKVTYRSGER